MLHCRILLIFQGQKFTSKAFKVEAGAVTKNVPTIISTGEEKVNPGIAKKKKKKKTLKKYIYYFDFFLKKKKLQNIN